MGIVTKPWTFVHSIWSWKVSYTIMAERIPSFAENKRSFIWKWTTLMNFIFRYKSVFLIVNFILNDRIVWAWGSYTLCVTNKDPAMYIYQWSSISTSLILQIKKYCEGILTGFLEIWWLFPILKYFLGRIASWKKF